MPDQPVERQPGAHAARCTAAGLRWGLRHAGVPGAPRLLLIHGTGSSGASWAAVAERLAGQFDMLLPDLPGHGGTDGFADHHASLPRMADALAGLLGHLGWAPDLIAGHSAGAAVMLQLALAGRARQARGLLSLNGALQPLPGLLGAVAPAVARIASRTDWLPAWVTRHAGQPRALNHLIASTGSQLDDAGVAHYRELLKQPDHVRGVLDMLASWRLDALQARLHELRVPLWLAAGLADRTVPPGQSRDLAGRLRGASFHGLPGLGHLAHEEAPEQVSALLLALQDATRGSHEGPISAARPAHHSTS